jgi:MFS family permease
MHRRVEFLLLSAGWGANHFATLLVVYRKELGFSPAALGLLFGAYALGLVPGLVLAGRVSDERGRRAVVLPASFLAIGATLLLAFGSYGFGVLLAGRLIFGVAMGSIMSPGSVWVQELSEPGLGPRRATLALSAGFGLGPLVSGVVAEFGRGPMVVPYALHAVVMATAVAFVRPVPETAKLAARPASGEAIARAPRSLGAPEFAVLAGLLPVAPWAFGLPAVTMAIVPGIMRPHVARPVLYSAFVILTTLASGVLVQPLTTRLGRSGDRVGLAVGALGIAVAAHAVRLTSPGLVFAAAALAGAGYGLVMTTGLREVSDRVPSRARGTAVGLYYVLTYVGFALPFLHATVAARPGAGDAATLETTAAAALVCLLIRAATGARPR